VNGVVYVGSYDDYVYALNASSGRWQWRYQTGGAVQSSPAVVNGVVYAGSEDKYVYALNASSGTLQWRYQTGGAVQSSPAVVNSLVYIGSDDDYVYALNASTGRRLWRYRQEALLSPRQRWSTAWCMLVPLMTTSMRCPRKRMQVKE